MNRAALVLGLGGAIAIAGMANAGTDEELADELRSRCRPGTAPASLGLRHPKDFGVIQAEGVRDALDVVYPFGAKILVSRPSDPADQRSNIEWLADRALAATRESKDEDATLYYVARLVDEWTLQAAPDGALLPLDRGGVFIAPQSPGLSRKQTLMRILAGDGQGLTIVCRWPEPEPPSADGAAAKGPRFRLAKSAADLDEPKISDRSFAEFSYSDDRQEHVQAWGVEFAAGLVWPEEQAGGAAGYLHWTPRAHLAYERRGENDPDDDGYVNNLNFGVGVRGSLGFATNWFSYYTLSAVYETDDRFDSAAYAGELRLDPPLPRLPYHRFEQGIGSGRKIDARARWTLDLVADAVQVDDPGRKAALEDEAEYLRLGYDLGAMLRLGPVRSDWAWVLRADYQLRDGQTRDGGDAQLFTSSLTFEGGEDARQSFGISYERGENLESFESSEIWKLFFGLRY